MLAIDAAEEELDKFKENLKAFKPRQSVLEIGLAKTLDNDRLNKFQNILSHQNEKYQEKLQRREYAADLKKQFEAEQRIHDEHVIKLKNLEIENDRKLKDAEESKVHKMSKKRRLKIEKIKSDETLTAKEKEILIS